MTDADKAWAERMTEDLAEATRANAALQARVGRAEQERDFCAAVLEGRDPNSPAGDGCPKCKCCGRDGHQGAVAREAALRLVRRAENRALSLEREVVEVRDHLEEANAYGQALEKVAQHLLLCAAGANAMFKDPVLAGAIDTFQAALNAKDQTP